MGQEQLKFHIFYYYSFLRGQSSKQASVFDFAI